MNQRQFVDRSSVFGSELNPVNTSRQHSAFSVATVPVPCMTVRRGRIACRINAEIPAGQSPSAEIICGKADPPGIPQPEVERRAAVCRRIRRGSGAGQHWRGQSSCPVEQPPFRIDLKARDRCINRQGELFSPTAYFQAEVPGARGRLQTQGQIEDEERILSLGYGRFDRAAGRVLLQCNIDFRYEIGCQPWREKIRERR